MDQRGGNSGWQAASWSGRYPNSTRNRNLSIFLDRHFQYAVPYVLIQKIILPIAIAACAFAAQFAPAAPPPEVKEIMSKP